MSLQSREEKYLYALDNMLFNIVTTSTYIFFGLNIDFIFNFMSTHVFKNFNNFDYKYNTALFYFVCSFLAYSLLSFILSMILYKIIVFVFKKVFNRIIKFISKSTLIFITAKLINLITTLFVSIIVFNIGKYLIINNESIMSETIEVNNKNAVSSTFINKLTSTDILKYLYHSSIFYNGTRLYEGVESSDDIRNITLEILNNETNTYNKAKKIYEWIGTNIAYDTELSEIIDKSATSEQYGAIYAMENRSGICFDFSALYVAMAREANLPVRLVCGDAFNGIEFGPHAWNQVYIEEEDRWINIDSTFYGYDDSFDSTKFDETHIAELIAGEWYPENFELNSIK